jgi:hypothetical protein
MHARAWHTATLLPNGKDMAVARGSTSSDVVRIHNF